APDGPWLWVYDQTGTPAGTTVFQFDPINHVMTGVSYNFPLPPGYTSNIAGGLCFTSDWNSTHWVLGALGQASPQDVLAVYEMYIAADPFAPAAPENFTVTPDAGGALNIDLAWDLPTTTVNGSPIGSYPITSVEVMRDGAPYASLAATATSYADAVPAAGNYAYSVYCVNSYGDGIPASGSAWAGLDVPAGCDNFVGAGVGVTLVAELAWDNPTVGAHGGYFPAGSIDGYTINRYGASTATFDLVGENTAYTDNTIPNPGFYHYGIAAYNASGAGAEVLTDEFYVGPAPFEPIAYDWIEINPNDPNVMYNGTNTGITSDDQNLGPFNLGFSFPSYDNSFFSSIRVCSNGFATFTSTATSYTNAMIPTTTEPNNLVAPYWDDMNPSMGGSIWYYADPGGQFFVVEWYDVPNYSTGGNYRFEAILYPNGDIDYMYADLTPGTAFSATVGIENGTGTTGLQVTYNGSGPINPTALSGIRIYSVGGGMPDISTVITYQSGSPVPPAGGPVNYNASVTNNEGTTQNFDVWVNVTLPNANIFNLINRNLNMPAGGNAARDLVLNVPEAAPAGTYTMTLGAGVYGGVVYSSDSFTFEKTAGDNVGGNTQFTWTDWDEAEVMTVGDLPTSYALHGAYPNPFNPTSTISYALPQAGKVSLTVYDLQGRMVTELVNGYRDAGIHEANFDGTGLASGVYIYSLQAGDFSANGKMIMMK
ncbi:T9SS type A sorting domain-containing protein, partial [bacterium]|nr:T9SS type A sorting domain-containing protein [bacterium]